MHTRDQEFARQIYAQIEPLRSNDDLTKKKYSSMAFQLPVLILHSGLVQGLAFAASRSDASQRLLVSHLAMTLGSPNTDALLQISRTADLAEYMILTRRALQALSWYKRFAQSLLGVEDAEDAGD